MGFWLHLAVFAFVKVAPDVAWIVLSVPCHLLVWKLLEDA